jgi:hypothetical protein
MFRKRNRRCLIPWIPTLILISGCDDRATHIAREAADRQAQQNTAMAKLNQEVAGGTRRLVEADAKARHEILGVHRDLQAERTRLDTGWNALELERQQIARRRRTESMLVPVATFVGSAVLVALLLGFCWYALLAARRGDDADAQLNELLVCELLPDEPPLIAHGQPLRTLLSQDHSEERPDD